MLIQLLEKWEIGDLKVRQEMHVCLCLCVKERERRGAEGKVEEERGE